ncbi:MAG: type II toxin-antitoxin system VapC family toxin [Rhodospirillales bacterium]|nr:type II toxin-antitoxin system VapC family toxin [Rhodospirillales bacterium]
MSRVHLDTHALIWMLEESPKLGRRAQGLVRDALSSDALAVSAIVFWEAAMLVDKRRLRLTEPPERWRQIVLGIGIAELPIDGEIGVAAVSLRGLHPDPTDRMIVATALSERATLITADRRVLAWKGGLKCHDARV